MRKISLLLLLIFGLAACAGSNLREQQGDRRAAQQQAAQGQGPQEAAEPAASRPLMWRAALEDGGVVYLFGSIHAGRADMYPLDDRIMGAFGRSDYLAVEVDIVALETDFAAAMQMAQMMMYPPGMSIADEIGADLHARAADVLAGLGVPPGLYDGFRPAMWSSLLLLAALDVAGLEAAYGIDEHFIRAAYARDMPVLAMESWDSQMQMLIDLSPELQMMLIESALDLDAAAQGITDLLAAWLAGDAQLLTYYLTDPQGLAEDLHSEYMYALLISRDRAMAEVAMGFLQDGRNVFLVVGLAHLLGDDSIIGLLRDRGVDVQQVR